MQLDFDALFEEHVKATEKNWSHDRSATVGASEIFGCLRSVWFKKKGKEHGYEADPDHEEDWGALRRGDVMENFWVVPAIERLGLKGVGVKYVGDDQVTLVDGLNSATPDGILYGLERDALKKYGVDDILSDSVMLEIKSIDPRVSLSEEKAVHRGQVQQQMGIVRKRTKFKPWYAIILYVDCSFFSQMKVFPVKFEPKVWKSAQERAETVFSTEDPAEISAEGKFDGSCRYCAFRTACAQVQFGSLPSGGALALGNEDALADEAFELLRREREAREVMKAAEKEHEEAKSELRDFLKDNDARKLDGPGWKVSLSWVKGRRTLSKDLITDAGLDPEDFMRDGNGYEKMTVSWDD